MASHGAHLEHRVLKPGGDFPCGSWAVPVGSALVPAPTHLGDPFASSKCSSGWLRPLNVPEGDTQGEGSHPPESNRLTSPWLAGSKVLLFWEHAYGAEGGVASPCASCNLAATRWHDGFALPLRNVCHKVASGHLLPLCAHPPPACRALYGHS